MTVDGSLPFVPAVGVTPLTARQRSLLAVAHELGSTRFAPRAHRWDDTATFPFENYADLRDAGFLALCIPEARGGHGADYATYCLVAAELGRFCGATALTFNMHSCSTLWIGALADALPMDAAQRAEHARRRDLHYTRVVDEGRLYAQPFSEGSAAAAGRAPFGTTARRDTRAGVSGWVIAGRKIWASLSGAADYYGILCTEAADEASTLDMRDTLYIAVPAASSGLTISGEWNPMGMRGTVSRNIAFDDVFVPDDEQLLPRGQYYRAAQTWPHMFFTCRRPISAWPTPRTTSR